MTDQQPIMSKQEAKAQAAAAKAYAKSQRNWFAKHKILTGLGALIVIVIIASAAGGGGSQDKTSTSSDTTATETTAPEATTPPETTAPVAGSGSTATLPIQNGDWRLDSIRVVNDGLGDFGATGRVTYTGDDGDGGNNVFTLTIFKGGKDIGVLQGSASTVLPGKTVTVQFISTDKVVAGPYTYDFQNDL